MERVSFHYTTSVLVILCYVDAYLYQNSKVSIFFDLGFCVEIPSQWFLCTFFAIDLIEYQTFHLFLYHWTANS